MVQLVSNAPKGAEWTTPSANEGSQLCMTTTKGVDGGHQRFKEALF